MEQDSREFILRCTCGDKSEHVVHIAQYDLTTKYSDANMGTCLVSTRLDPYRPWYKRLWVGIKYICGYAQYQYIDSVIDVQVLKDVVAQLEDTRTDEEKAHAKDCKSHIEVL